MDSRRQDAPMILREAQKGGFIRVNHAFTENLGFDSTELQEREILEWIHAEDRATFKSMLSEGSGRIEARHLHKEGHWVPLTWELKPGEDPSIVLGLVSDSISKNGRGQRTGVKSIPSPMAKTLRDIAWIVEDHNPGMKCSILLVDEETQRVSVGAGPSLPDEYNSAVEGLHIGPTVGSCGTASYWNVQVVVEDIQADPLWRNLKDYAEKAGVASCWSHPITDAEDKACGAMALYNPEPRVPTQQELKSLETAARMVSLAVERGLAEEALRESEQKAHQESDLLSAVTMVVSAYVNSNDWEQVSELLLEKTIDLTKSECGFVGIFEKQELKLISSLGDVCKGIEGPEFFKIVQNSFKQDGYLLLREGELAKNDPSEERGLQLNEEIDVTQLLVAKVSTQSKVSKMILAVPILIEDEIAAVILIGKPESNYSEQDLHIVKHLCRAGSLMLDSQRRQYHEESLKEKLRTAERMEAIGVLAGGVAHDFNNMLTTILGNLHLAEKSIGITDLAATQEYLGAIKSASLQSADLCNQMLAYAGRRVYLKEPAQIDELIQEVLDLLKVMLPRTTSVELQSNGKELFTEADKVQVRQVFMNLVSNASESITHDHGKIQIKIEVDDVDPNCLYCFGSLKTLKEQKYIKITVSDNGSGMDEATQNKVFDPFFTTKFTGRGLGLAAVKGIIKNHRGAIALQSELGKGTTVSIYFPRVEEPSKLSPEAEKRKEISINLKNKKVLVVDDQKEVRKVIVEILKDSGLDIREASGGLEAINILSTEEDIDCILLDLTMPKLDGKATFQELRKIHAKVPVLLTSGYSEEESLDRFQGESVAGFVKKPVMRDALIEKISKAIEGAMN